MREDVDEVGAAPEAVEVERGDVLEDAHRAQLVAEERGAALAAAGEGDVVLAAFEPGGAAVDGALVGRGHPRVDAQVDAAGLLGADADLALVRVADLDPGEVGLAVDGEVDGDEVAIELDGAAPRPEHRAGRGAGGAAGDDARAVEEEERGAGPAAHRAAEALADAAVGALRRVGRRGLRHGHERGVLELRLHEVVAPEAVDVVPVLGEVALHELHRADHHVGGAGRVAALVGRELPLQELRHPPERGGVASDVVVEGLGARDVAVLREDAPEAREAGSRDERRVDLALELGLAAEEVREAGDRVGEAAREVERGGVARERVVDHRRVDERREAHRRVREARRELGREAAAAHGDVRREGVDRPVGGEGAGGREAALVRDDEAAKPRDEPRRARGGVLVRRVERDHPVQGGEDRPHLGERAVVVVPRPGAPLREAQPRRLLPAGGVEDDLAQRGLGLRAARGGAEHLARAGDALEPDGGELRVVAARVLRERRDHVGQDLPPGEAAELRVGHRLEEVEGEGRLPERVEGAVDGGPPGGGGGGHGGALRAWRTGGGAGDGVWPRSAIRDSVAPHSRRKRPKNQADSRGRARIRLRRRAGGGAAGSDALDGDLGIDRLAEVLLDVSLERLHRVRAGAAGALELERDGLALDLHDFAVAAVLLEHLADRLELLADLLFHVVEPPSGPVVPPARGRGRDGKVGAGEGSRTLA